MREAKTYIGDAVYGEDLGSQVRLSTQRSFDTHWMVLGNAEIWYFLRWLRFRGYLPDEALEQLKAYTPSGPEELKEDDLGGLDHASD
jgi:hypothetical protein